MAHASPVVKQMLDNNTKRVQEGPPEQTWLPCIAFGCVLHSQSDSLGDPVLQTASDAHMHNRIHFSERTELFLVQFLTSDESETPNETHRTNKWD